MTHLFTDFHITNIKSFDGYCNYLNVSGKQNKLLIRKEELIQDTETKFILSSIVDEKEQYILSSDRDSLYLHSYEDPRYISDTKFTFNLCYFDSYTEIMGTKMGYCNIKTKQHDLYNFAKWEYEKNWQVDNNKVVYSIEPLEIYNKNFEPIKINKPNKKWDYWYNKYGIPRLSTNIFNIEEKYYTIFHSKIIKNKIKDVSILRGFAGDQQYYCGIVEVTKNYIPISYYRTPIFPSMSNYNMKVREEYINWRQKTNSTWRVDIIFPTNVEVIDNNIFIYCGINDCNAAIITIDKKEFIKKLNNAEKIIL